MSNKKSFFKLYGMAFLALLIMSPLFYSCSRVKSLDMTDLLSTVPSSSGAVIGVNMRSMLEKIGCKVNGSHIEADKELMAYLGNLSETKKQALEIFLDDRSGIDPLGAVVFFDANRSYLTFALADTDTFRALVENNNGDSFQSSPSGVEICQNVAVKGAQAWVLLSGRGFDPDLIASYCTLGESQSFLSNPFGKMISTMTQDIVGWGRINTLLNPNLTFDQIATLNLFSSVMFEDAYALNFSANFLKGKLESSLTVLNDKGKPAKYLLPDNRLDVETVKSVADNSCGLFAMTINKKMVEVLQKSFSPLLGPNGSSYFNSLKAADGTFAIAIGNDTISEALDNFRGVLTTDGNPSVELKSLISILGPIKVDGKLLKFYRGEMTAGNIVADNVDKLKGATMGVVVSSSLMSDYLSSLEMAAIKAVPESDGIRLDIEVASTTKNENFLLTALKENISL